MSKTLIFFIIFVLFGIILSINIARSIGTEVQVLSGAVLASNNTISVEFTETVVNSTGLACLTCSCNLTLRNLQGSANQFSQLGSHLANGVFNFSIPQPNTTGMYPLTIDCNDNISYGRSSLGALIIVDELTEAAVQYIISSTNNITNVVSQINNTVYIVNNTVYYINSTVSGINQTVVGINSTVFSEFNYDKFSDDMHIVNSSFTRNVTNATLFIPGEFIYFDGTANNGSSALLDNFNAPITIHIVSDFNLSLFYQQISATVSAGRLRGRILAPNITCTLCRLMVEVEDQHDNVIIRGWSIEQFNVSGQFSIIAPIAEQEVSAILNLVEQEKSQSSSQAAIASDVDTIRDTFQQWFRRETQEINIITDAVWLKGSEQSIVVRHHPDYVATTKKLVIATPLGSSIITEFNLDAFSSSSLGRKLTVPADIASGSYYISVELYDGTTRLADTVKINILAKEESVEQEQISFFQRFRIITEAIILKLKS